MDRLLYDDNNNVVE